MNPILSGLFICESSSDGHAVFSGEEGPISSGPVTVDGPVADRFIKGEQYEITINYVGDKPPHP